MKETLIQTAIEHYLALLENTGKLVYQKNNTGAFKAQHGSFVRFGKAGSPDFYIFIKNGQCLHIEVKNEKGKLNDNQTDYQQTIEKLGHTYLIVRSVDEVEKYLKENRLI
jgi:hypothetical protein